MLVLPTPARRKKKRIVAKIENISELKHFQDGPLNFQNLQKNQHFAENSPRKLRSGAENHPKSHEIRDFYSENRKI